MHNAFSDKPITFVKKLTAGNTHIFSKKPTLKEDQTIRKFRIVQKSVVR